MAVAVAKAVEAGARAIVCASTGNTAASAAAYAKGFLEAGFPALKLVPVEAADRATTGASAIRIPTPVHRAEVDEALARSGGAVVSVTDGEIAVAWRSLARHEGIFCEPASAAGLAGVGLTNLAEGTRVVIVLTGHGLKDPAALDRLPEAV
jgi:threonine synthase